MVVVTTSWRVSRNTARLNSPWPWSRRSGAISSIQIAVTTWQAPDDRCPYARALSDHGGGHARQVAREGRRYGQVRRRHRRDRDRQGHYGGRGGRRRHGGGPA